MPALQDRLRQALKPLYSGVSWQNPVISAVIPAVDVVERKVRERRGLGHLPPYSARIRSTGMDGEFGGVKYVLGGKGLEDSLIRHAALKPTDRLLDIGCGSARLGMALTNVLEPGAYIGLDVDTVAIGACRRTPKLQRFEFVAADITNGMYRPDGMHLAETYKFPFDDASFDVVFLASVYTHMLEEACANYSREILRMLKPGGRAVVTTYLHDDQAPDQAFTFPHQVGRARVEYADAPLKVVSYPAAAFEEWFGQAPAAALRGLWRRDGAQTVEEWQDWMIFTR